MDAYKDYFSSWFTSNGRPISKEWQDLIYKYNDADDQLSYRINQDSGRESKPNALKENNSGIDEAYIEKHFEKPLQEINAKWDSYQKEPELKQMAHLTKGNILLREGQYLGLYFHDPHECYQQSCVILEQNFDPDAKDFFNLMIQLNLGRHFQNLARCNQRSEYWRALDEFKEIKDKIETSSQGRFNLWETHLWLEAEVNIGQTERYLYLLQQSKKHLQHLVQKLSCLCGETEMYAALSRYLPAIEFHEEGSYSKLDDNQDLRDLYTDYLKNALVQLGITYQKSRDYEIAQEICVQILKMDECNIDAANNLGVCLRKQRKKKSLNDLRLEESQNGSFPWNDYGHSKYIYQTYQEIFDDLQKAGNHFAQIQHIKCKMDDLEKSTDKKAIQAQLDEWLNINPKNQEVRLLKGILYIKLGKLEEAQQILEDLYKESPHIAKGTLALKAYYNRALILLAQKNFHEAEKYFNKIEKECEKTDSRNTVGDDDTNLLLRDLPKGDLLAQIDKGWCLMHFGDYKEAAKCYENILTAYKGMEHRLTTTNEMKIKNNLGECYIHCRRTKDAQKVLESILEKEPNNSTTNRLLGYLYKLKSENEDSRQMLEKSLSYFEKAAVFGSNDIHAHSGWIASALLLLQQGPMGISDAEKQKKRTELMRKIENKLRYSSDIYPMKTYAKLASYIRDREKEYGPQSPKITTMHRSLARVHLSESEEGFGLFRHLLDNDIFRRLDAASRGKILVALFRLYGKVIEIKETCRFIPDQNKSIENYLPVHYTKIDTLKKLLPSNASERGQLRLWNTVYMNDSFEGESFIDMMKYTRGEDASEILKKYFKYLDKKSVKKNASEREVLVPNNENIYVISFSEQEDAIHMWVPYAADATGCTIKFAEDFFDLRKTPDTITDVSSYSDKDYPLYQIQYLEEGWKENQEMVQKNGKIDRILTIMKEIWDILDDLEERLREEKLTGQNADTDTPDSEEAEFIRNFVSDCLNEIRFLIKSSEYSYEREVRMLHSSYDPILAADYFNVPRLYVEVERDIQIREVTLGSKISDAQANEIFSWLNKTTQVGHIIKSKRHYK